MRLRLTLDPLAEADVDAVVRLCGPVLTRVGDEDVLRAAGPAALEACHALRGTLPGGRLAVGQAVTTGAGALASRHLVHLVAPSYDLRDGTDRALRSAYRAVLAAADAVGSRSLALAPLGTTLPYWPLEMAVAAAVGTLGNAATGVREVRLVLRTPAGLEPFAEALARR